MRQERFRAFRMAETNVNNETIASVTMIIKPNLDKRMDKQTNKQSNKQTRKQVVIVQYGGVAFSTAALTLDQWLWCIFFGFGVLVWGQIITSIPTKKIPKRFTWGSGPPDEMMDVTSSLVEDGSSGSLSHDMRRSGQILWIRGLTRLQTQIRVVNAFRSSTDGRFELKTQLSRSRELLRQMQANRNE